MNNPSAIRFGAACSPASRAKPRTIQEEGGRKHAEGHQPDPNRGDHVEDAHDAVEIPPGEQGSDDKAHPGHQEHDSQNNARRGPSEG